jgi:hypothetical protein
VSRGRHVAPEDVHAALLDALGAGHEAQQRRLAHAIRPDHPGKTAGRDVERDVVERDNMPVAVTDALEADDRRIANVGEVLPAGGKVFTLLDVGYVYMDIYLPTATAGRVRIGNDARRSAPPSTTSSSTRSTSPTIRWSRRAMAASSIASAPWTRALAARSSAVAAPDAESRRCRRGSSATDRLPVGGR